MELHDDTIKQLRERNHLSVMANCHIPGLFSIVLDERQDAKRGMSRIFFAGPECDMEHLHKMHPDRTEQRDFSILPHNHRQDICLYHLCGTTTNVQLHFATNPLGPVLSRGDRVTEFVFGSALMDGDRSFSLEARQKMLVVERYDRKRLTPGGLFLAHQVVHTVMAEPNSAWLVVEGQQAGPSFRPLCYSRNKELVLSSEGLYEVLDKKVGAIVVDHLTGLIDGRTDHPLGLGQKDRHRGLGRGLRLGLRERN